VPDGYEQVMDRLAQNLFLAAPTISQYAALAAFDSETIAILNQRRNTFEQRRDSLLPALRAIGLKVDAPSQGAFYIYADCRQILTDKYPDSMALSKYWLDQAGVAVTPGNDFGHYLA
jgi:aspartate/methionine/tyrosine aminotransferase